MPSLKPRKPQPAVAEPSAAATSHVAEQPADLSAGHAHAPAAQHTTEPAASHANSQPAATTGYGGPGDEMQFRTNPQVEKDIANYKEAHPREVEYFSNLVRNHPDRAINFHFLQQQRQHAAETKAAMRQMPQAQAIYEKMTPESKQRVDERMANVTKYDHTRRYVAAVFGEMNRQAMAANRRMMTAPITKADLGAARPDAPAPNTAPAKMSVG